MYKFTPKDRGIFQYFDPDHSITEDGLVYADPFDIEERWKKCKLEAETEIDNDFKNLGLQAEGYDPESDDPDPYEDIKTRALINLIPFSHAVFKTQPIQLDGSGLKFDEAIGNLTMWMDFFSNVKKNIDEMPNSPTSTQDSKEKSNHGKNISDSSPTSRGLSSSARIP